jgi:hypothetical protein
MSPRLSQKVTSALYGTTASLQDVIGRITRTRTETIHEYDALQSRILTDPEYILVPDVRKMGRKGVQVRSGTQYVGELSDRTG